MVACSPPFLGHDFVLLANIAHGTGKEEIGPQELRSAAMLYSVDDYQLSPKKWKTEPLAKDTTWKSCGSTRLI